MLILMLTLPCVLLHGKLYWLHVALSINLIDCVIILSKASQNVHVTIHLVLFIMCMYHSFHGCSELETRLRIKNIRYGLLTQLLMTHYRSRFIVGYCINTLIFKKPNIVSTSSNIPLLKYVCMC